MEVFELTIVLFFPGLAKEVAMGCKVAVCQNHSTNFVQLFI